MSRSATAAVTNTNKNDAVLLVLAGPAGSGKSTLCERIVAEAPDFHRVVTATTRAPREGEKNGVHYHFLTPEEFDACITAGDFLEWAWVHKKNRYGTLSKAVIEPLEQGHNLIINIDVQGVDSFRKAAAANPLLARRMTTVYIDVPPAIMRQRLEGRGTDGPEEIARRMRTAEIEVLEKDKFDHVIVSASREEDFEALKRVWQAARRKASA